MPYWDRPTSTSTPQIDSVSMTKIRGGGGAQDAFYEIEPAIVLDIILDKDHPYIKKTPLTLNNDKWPADVDGRLAKKTDPDYTWLGRALVRLFYTQRNIEKEDLVWALPLEANPAEYPLLNEVVGVVSYLGQFYYTRQINTTNLPNVNADFNLELNNGGFRNTSLSPLQGNREYRTDEKDPFIPFQGPVSKLKIGGGTGYQGALGRYFVFNSRIRSLKRREGDFLVESRFGQSIRLGTYGESRDDDKGYNSDFAGYADYKGNGQKYKVGDKEFEAGGGNPMILIRNRQRPLTSPGKETKVYENLPAVKGTEEEKNVGGYITEDVNNDGSSIHMTSGTTISMFRTNCAKKMWGTGEEQTGFSGTTLFKYPKLLGDQIVINSDRLILSSKKGEMFHYSKKRYAVVTDDECTIDAHNQIVFTTNNKTVLNSPAIYLGEYEQTNEPVLLGQTTVNWLYDLCQWLTIHTHWYKHTHPDAGKANPDKSQAPVQVESLKQLRNQLNTLMSRRVFVVGGGLAPGKNGAAGDIKNGAAPVVVTLPSGAGVPGGFTGTNKKMTAEQKKKQEDDVKSAQTDSKEATASAAKASEDATATRAALNTAARAASSVRTDRTAVQAAKTASKASTEAKKQADLSKKYAVESSAQAKIAETTDNDFIRIEAKVATTEAANKAKASADLASSARKTAENAAATATEAARQAQENMTQTSRNFRKG